MGTVTFDLGEGPLIEQKFFSVEDLFRKKEALQRKHRKATVKVCKISYRSRAVAVK